MPQEFQYEALAQVKQLAADTGAFRVLSAQSDVEVSPADGKFRWDWLVDVAATAGAGRAFFLVAARRRVTPQTAWAMLNRMKANSQTECPLLYCPVLSPRIRQLCNEHSVSYLDRAGNCRIAAPGLFLERLGLASVGEEKPLIDPFAAKASRVARAMLSDPVRGWQVQQLARWEGLGVSLGLASRVKQALLEQAYAFERERLLYLRNPDDLLEAWAKNYRPNVAPIPLYVVGDPPQSEAAVAEWCTSNNVRYALTQFSGGWRCAPAVRYQRSTIYVQGIDHQSRENLRQFCDARRVDSGANVILWHTPDPAVFIGQRPLGNPPLNTVSGLQLYLDLKQLRGRGDEAARAVYDAEIAPSFAEARKPLAT